MHTEVKSVINHVLFLRKTAIQPMSIIKESNVVPKYIYERLAWVSPISEHPERQKNTAKRIEIAATDLFIAPPLPSQDGFCVIYGVTPQDTSGVKYKTVFL